MQHSACKMCAGQDNFRQVVGMDEIWFLILKNTLLPRYLAGLTVEDI